MLFTRLFIFKDFSDYSQSTKKFSVNFAIHIIIVSELMGWVRNVILIKCIFGSGKPRGVEISGGRVYEPSEGMGKLVYEQPGNEVDGSCHRRRVPSK
jgi:hypothetical protein